MGIKKILAVGLILASLFVVVACGSKPAYPAALYSDIYTENAELDLETKQQIITRFDEAGLSAVDIGNQINMTNWEGIDEFCSQGKDDTAVIYVINDDGSYTQYDLSIAEGNLHVKMQVCSGGNESVITYEQEYDAVHWSYTD